MTMNKLYKLKEYHKKYYLEHKEKYNERSKKDYQERKEFYNELGKKYYQEHKEELKKRHKEYYEKHKEIIKDQTKTWKQNNKKRWVEICSNNRKKRVERLKKEGCINPWSVIRGYEPKYKQEVCDE